MEDYQLMPKISIVTSYYNRKDSLLRTLKVMEKSSFKDFEFIIIDDGSDWRQRIEDLAQKFSFVRLTRIEPGDKKHINPCIPFNMAIGMAQGDIIILQSPECMYMGDVLKFVVDHSEDNQYLVFSCYSLGLSSSARLKDIDFNLSLPEIETQVTSIVGGFVNKGCDEGGRYGTWFVHPTYRRSIYNFLTSMPRKDMYDLGGFDERFADGFAFDDTDLAARIMKKKMKINIVEKPCCLHQFHHSVLEHIPNFRAKEQRNKILYEELLKSPNYRVKNSFLEGITK